MAKKEKLMYLKIKDSILKEFRSKPYYTPLPGERELCEIYNVSRPTVRKALELLEEEGFIVKLQGKGAFFVGNKKGSGGKNVNPTNIAFYNQVRLRGDYTSSKVLTQKVEIASDKVAAILGIPNKSKVFHLERLRYINGVLWTIADSYVPYDFYPSLMEYDFSERSLHNTMGQLGRAPFRAERHITVKKSDAYDAFHLGLLEGDPVCLTEALSFDTEGVLLEYSFSRGNVYNISYDLVTYNEAMLKCAEEYNVPENMIACLEEDDADKLNDKTNNRFEGLLC